MVKICNMIEKIIWTYQKLLKVPTSFLKKSYESLILLISVIFCDQGTVRE